MKTENEPQYDGEPASSHSFSLRYGVENLQSLPIWLGLVKSEPEPEPGSAVKY